MQILFNSQMLLSQSCSPTVCLHLFLQSDYETHNRDEVGGYIGLVCEQGEKVSGLLGQQMY